MTDLLPIHGPTPIRSAKSDSAESDSAESDLGDFPESYFAVPPKLASNYFATVSRGYQKMTQRRVVIGGLARNLGHLLPLTIARIEYLGSLFADYRVVIYENDSADRTLAGLKKWQSQNSRVEIISEIHNDPKHKPCRSLTRARRMAYYRSVCHEHIYQSFSEFDNAILVDTDLLGGWSYDGIANTFGHSEWDFVGANGVIFKRMWFSPNRLMQYDAWAYREDEQFTPHSTKTVNHMFFERGAPLHPVTSCFGGLGVYSMAAFRVGAYDGCDTEHVGFHRRLRQNGFDRMFLNPSQISLYGRRNRSWDPRIQKLNRFYEKALRKPATTWYYQTPAHVIPIDRRRRKAG